MCIAVLNPHDKTISKSMFDACSKNNHDGYGLMYTDTDGVPIFHSLSLDDFYERYEKIKNEHKKNKNTSPIVLHFRNGTSGGNTIENCHPFRINKNLGFVHNGVFPNLGDTSHSDTNHFNENVLKPILNTENFGDAVFNNDGFKQLLEGAAGWSKLIFLGITQLKNKKKTWNYQIINQTSGKWEDGSWYSCSTLPTENILCKNCYNKLYTDQEIKSNLCYSCAHTSTASQYRLYSHKCLICGIQYKTNEMVILIDNITNKTNSKSMYICSNCVNSKMTITEAINTNNVESYQSRGYTD